MRWKPEDPLELIGMVIFGSVGVMIACGAILVVYATLHCLFIGPCS